MVNKYYFTYGCDKEESKQPFEGGWTEIVLPEDLGENCARRLFSLIHPKDDGFLNCAGVYSEEDFKNTRMYTKGNNFGYSCHERYVLTKE